jgi:hypothetical protein
VLLLYSTLFADRFLAESRVILECSFADKEVMWQGTATFEILESGTKNIHYFSKFPGHGPNRIASPTLGDATRIISTNTHSPLG